jgi:hypothetical protein
MNTGQRAKANQVVCAHKLRRFKSDAGIVAYCNLNQLSDFQVSSNGQVSALDPYDRVITLGWIV